jgi:hypothetical protein
MKKISAIIFLSILSFLQISTCFANEAELNAFIKATRAKYDIKEQAFANNDPEPILNQFYSADVISTDFEGNTHVGTAGLRPVYEDPAVIGGTVKVESIYPNAVGNAGWDWANFHVTPADPNEKPFTFKILFLWEKIDGEWWCKGDMYTFGKFE